MDNPTCFDPTVLVLWDCYLTYIRTHGVIGTLIGLVLLVAPVIAFCPSMRLASALIRPSSQDGSGYVLYWGLTTIAVVAGFVLVVKYTPDIAAPEIEAAEMIKRPILMGSALTLDYCEAPTKPESKPAVAAQPARPIINDVLARGFISKGTEQAALARLLLEDAWRAEQTRRATYVPWSAWAPGYDGDDY